MRCCAALDSLTNLVRSTLIVVVPDHFAIDPCAIDAFSFARCPLHKSCSSPVALLCEQVAHCVPHSGYSGWAQYPVGCFRYFLCPHPWQRRKRVGASFSFRRTLGTIDVVPSVLIPNFHLH